jgi:hypothetical protein
MAGPFFPTKCLTEKTPIGVNYSRGLKSRQKKPPSFFRGDKNDSVGILVQSDLFTCDRARVPVVRESGRIGDPSLFAVIGPAQRTSRAAPSRDSLTQDEKLTDRTRKQQANILAADVFRRIARRMDAQAVSGLGIAVEIVMKPPRRGACGGKL